MCKDNRMQWNRNSIAKASAQHTQPPGLRRSQLSLPHGCPVPPSGRHPLKLAPGEEVPARTVGGAASPSAVAPPVPDATTTASGAKLPPPYCRRLGGGKCRLLLCVHQPKSEGSRLPRIKTPDPSPGFSGERFQCYHHCRCIVHHLRPSLALNDVSHLWVGASPTQYSLSIVK